MDIVTHGARSASPSPPSASHPTAPAYVRGSPIRFIQMPTNHLRGTRALSICYSAFRADGRGELHCTAHRITDHRCGRRARQGGCRQWRSAARTRRRTWTRTTGRWPPPAGAVSAPPRCGAGYGSISASCAAAAAASAAAPSSAPVGSTTTRSATRRTSTTAASAWRSASRTSAPGSRPRGTPPAPRGPRPRRVTSRPLDGVAHAVAFTAYRSPARRRRAPLEEWQTGNCSTRLF
jgi:hypothetical protein